MHSLDNASQKTECFSAVLPFCVGAISNAPKTAPAGGWRSPAALLYDSPVGISPHLQTRKHFFNRCLVNILSLFLCRFKDVSLACWFQWQIVRIFRCCSYLGSKLKTLPLWRHLIASCILWSKTQFAASDIFRFPDQQSPFPCFFSSFSPFRFQTRIQ